MNKGNTQADRNNTYAGFIYASDFETDYPNDLAGIASRIASALKFDELCKRNTENRERCRKGGALPSANSELK